MDTTDLVVSRIKALLELDSNNALEPKLSGHVRTVLKAASEVIEANCPDTIQVSRAEYEALRAEVASLKEERDAYKERGEARGQSVRDLTQQLAAGMVEMLAGALRTSMVALDDWLNIFASEFCDKQRVKEAYARINAEGTIAYLSGIQESNRTALSNLNEDRAG
jgi:hypothetical protein